MNCRKSSRSKSPAACPRTSTGTRYKPATHQSPKTRPPATPEPMPSMPSLLRLLAPTALRFSFVAPAQAVDEKDLLPVDEAFALSASAPERGRIELHWKIAEGYYLYRHRIAAQPVDTPLSNN